MDAFADDPAADAAGTPAPALPVTGHAGIDAAMAALDLGDDVHTHPEALAAALDAVAAALNPAAQPPLLRP